MSNIARVAGQAANTLSKPLDITDVFSTYLYDGTASARTITNGIDLAGEGGLVWTKGRSVAYSHSLVDTERGGSSILFTNGTNSENAGNVRLSSFNSDGYSLALSAGGNFDASGHNYASWTFRKAPKFFDVVTWTGDGQSTRSIPHSLGAVPGFITIKRTNATGGWYCWHRNFTGPGLYLNSTGIFPSDPTAYSSTQTDSDIALSGTLANASGTQYVAYLFAHNDGDGGFGPDGDADIIKCGSYTGDGTTDGSKEIDLGFEPQWILTKTTNQAATWNMWDVMRGMPVGGSDARLMPNLSTAESTAADYIHPTSTGFSATGSITNTNGINYIYIAIRRGPLAVPEDATDVFAIDQDDGVGSPAFISGFPVDFNFYRNVNSAQGAFLSSRLTGDKYMQSTSTAAESSSVGFTWDYMDGFRTGPLTTDFYGWMWKRAPGYFDAVAYTGNGSPSNGYRDVTHNLGVQPEMMWLKRRDSTSEWTVNHKDAGAGYLNLTNSFNAYPRNGYSHNDAFTATTFSAKAQDEWNFNVSGATYIAYLFASAPGVSKVGSYTGNGSSQTIDCGFTSGARFVLIKNASESDNWYVFDSERGIVSGADPYLRLNTTLAEQSEDFIDPDSSGFAVSGSDPGNNKNGNTYIFYAIA